MADQKLTYEQEQYIQNQISDKIIDFINEEKFSKENKINYLNKLIKAEHGKTSKESKFYISRLELELSYLQPEISTIPTQQSKKQKPETETPKTFEELFYNTELVTPCIDILKELHPPLIDTDYNYIGSLKGTICVWIDELQRGGIIKHYSDRKIFAELIPLKIKRFSIDESMFAKHHKRAEDFRMDIKTKISKIKLSHDSQKGK